VVTAEYSIQYIMRQNRIPFAMGPSKMQDTDFTFVHEGHLEYCIDGGKPISIKAGEGLFVPSGRMRERLAGTQKATYTSLIIKMGGVQPPQLPFHIIPKESSDIEYCLDSLLNLYAFPPENSERSVSYFIDHLLHSLILQTARKNSVYYMALMKEYIAANWNGKIDLESVSRSAHISKSYASHLFKSETGMLLNSYITDLRIKKAAEMLEFTGYKINTIAEMTGF